MEKDKAPSLGDLKIDQSGTKNRLQYLLSQLHPLRADPTLKDKDVPLLHGKQLLSWNGWGFMNGGFTTNKDKPGEIIVTGPYPNAGVLPKMWDFLTNYVGMDINDDSPGQNFASVRFPPSNINSAFIASLTGRVKLIDCSDSARLYHSRVGHSCQEIWMLRQGQLPKLVDAVIYPSCHEEVELIIQNANEHNVCLIPFGGGTSVSQALMCPMNEERMIVSIDTHEMNRLKWVDKSNLMACFEAGVRGQEIDTLLAAHGLCLGHEPDSHEFSCLGGWIATRCSGMKKNEYGAFEKNFIAPRVSIGPDIHQMILGSEGIYGIVTEAVLKVRPIPECTRFGSIIFPDFTTGVSFLREVAYRRITPASLRLVDNTQFKFGQAMVGQKGWSESLLDTIKKWYVTKHLKYDPDKMVIRFKTLLISCKVAATILFVGTNESVRAHEKIIFDLAASYSGLSGGEDNGRRGYELTFMIAYIRDFCLDHYWIGESFETSVSWNNLIPLCDQVSNTIIRVCKSFRVRGKPFISYRVPQLYDIGACVYFYFGFCYKGLSNPIAVYENIEHEARETILRCGGTLSHHHGVGKLRKSFMPIVQTEIANESVKALKKHLDPKNIFCADNIV